MIIEKEKTSYLLKDSIRPELKDMFITWASGELFAKDYYKKIVDFWHSKGIYQLDDFVWFANNRISAILNYQCLSVNIPYPEDEDNDWEDIFDPIEDAFNFEIERLNELYDIINKAQELKDWNSYNIALKHVDHQIDLVNKMRILNQISSSELAIDTIIKDISDRLRSNNICCCGC